MLHQQLQRFAKLGLLALVCSALSLFWAFSATAQVERLAVNITALTSEEDTSVQTIVTVLDSSSRPLVDLTQAAFSVELNGQPAMISSLERAIDRSQPISVLLALDVSASMAGSTRRRFSSS